jgi:hypothetical protein
VALVDLGFDNAADVAAQTMLDEGMVDALLRQPPRRRAARGPEAVARGPGARAGAWRRPVTWRRSPPPAGPPAFGAAA